MLKSIINYRKSRPKIKRQDSLKKLIAPCMLNQKNVILGDQMDSDAHSETQFDISYAISKYAEKKKKKS